MTRSVSTLNVLVLLWLAWRITTDLFIVEEFHLDLCLVLLATVYVLWRAYVGPFLRAVIQVAFGKRVPPPPSWAVPRDPRD